VTDRDAAPPDVVVERGETDDAEAVADCWVALARDQKAYGSRLYADRNRSAAREAALRHAVTGGLFVARRVEDERPAGPDDEGDVLGFVTASPASGEFVEADERGAVRNLYVRPAERGRGIGTALLAAAEAHLEAQGVAVVSLEVLAGNEAARRFYRRHGYADHRMELRKSVGDR
jgi:ribosomal protein S18 acetylase RimI-like enzyme